GWVQTGGVVLSFIAAVGGAVVGVKLASKSKRDDNNSAVLTRSNQLNNNVKSLDEKLAKLLEVTSDEGIRDLSNILKSKTDLASVVNTIDNLSDNLKTINQHINKVHEKALEELDKQYLGDLKKCEDENKSLKAHLKDKERKLKDQDSNENDQWKIMKDLCDKFYTSDKNSQKTNTINYLKLIKVTKSIKCSDCLDAVGKLLPNSLEILEDAIKSAEEFTDFNSDKIDQLFELLWKLGTSFRDEMLKMKESDQGSLRTSQAAKSVFGRKYSPQGQKYSIRYKEKDFDMCQHLKIDGKSTYESPGTRKTNGTTDNSCLRIHFAWHEESEKVLIGHCGKHR
ncbi:MAG: hypothetical protein OXH24_04815, partial [Cyanobacteria bacterium MAG IRC3_bin_20]|nr:hypothetical protein [Cyanobacteria bacterium MAG IRC3_bin_20]